MFNFSIKTNIVIASTVLKFTQTIFSRCVNKVWQIEPMCIYDGSYVVFDKLNYYYTLENYDILLYNSYC